MIVGGVATTVTAQDLLLSPKSAEILAQCVPDDKLTLAQSQFYGGYDQNHGYGRCPWKENRHHHDGGGYGHQDFGGYPE